jgi:biopolymer transport protein ExbD
MNRSRYHVEAGKVLFHTESLQATPDINITPMIDVLLVLLVIFISALPLNQRALDIELPPTSDVAQPQPPNAQIVLEFTGERRLALNASEDVTLEALEGRLRTILEGRQDKTVFIMAAGALRYGEVVQIIDLAKGAGAEKVGLITEAMRRGRVVPPGTK